MALSADRCRAFATGMPLPGAVLAIDTSGATAGVALLLPGAGVAAPRLVARDAPSGSRASRVVQSLAADVLDEAHVALGDLVRLAAIRGPGSFTGLRVGLAAVAGWSLASGVPAVGVDTTAAVALAAGVLGRVVVALSAGPGRYFVSVHAVSEHAVDSLAGPADASTEESLRLLAEAPGRGVLRGGGTGGEALVAAGFTHFDEPIALAAACLAALRPESSEPCYAREPLIRPRSARP